MDNVNQYIKKYTSAGYELFDNNSDVINKSERLLITSTLEKEVSINKFFDRFNLLAPNCREVVLVERIVDIDDTFTNTLQFILDNTHIRFYTVPEIVDEFSKRFFMNEYNIFSEQIVIDKGSFKSEDVLNRVINIEDNIQRFINFKEDGSKISMNKIFGNFRFIKL